MCTKDGPEETSLPASLFPFHVFLQIRDGHHAHQRCPRASSAPFISLPAFDLPDRMALVFKQADKPVVTDKV